MGTSNFWIFRICLALQKRNLTRAEPKWTNKLGRQKDIVLTGYNAIVSKSVLNIQSANVWNAKTNVKALPISNTKNLARPTVKFKTSKNINFIGHQHAYSTSLFALTSDPSVLNGSMEMHFCSLKAYFSRIFQAFVIRSCFAVLQHFVKLIMHTW